MLKRVFIAINNFFVSWYTASGDAASRTSNEIEKIVTVASPPPEAKQDAWKGLVVDALLAGLAFVPIAKPEQVLFSSANSALKAAEAPGRVLIAASAGVYGHLFPNDGTALGDIVDIAALKTDLQDFTTDLQARFQPALTAAINDVDTFLELANTGAFSNAHPPSLPAQTAGLERALTTYIISVALSSANWNAVVAPATDVDGLLKGTYGKPNMEFGCDGVDPVTKMCNAVWSDVPNNQGLTLVQTTSFQNNPYDKYQQYFGGPEFYTTPELLMVGAAKCRLRPGWGTGVMVTIDENGLNLDCLSQMKVCTWRTDCSETDEGDCLYKEADCPSEEGHGFSPDRYRGNPTWDVEDARKFHVPPGYMGPFILQGNLQYTLQPTAH